MSTVTPSGENRPVERWNEVFEAIAVEPRRRLVVALLDAPPDETAPLPEAVVPSAAPADRRAIRRELVHCHLPKLAASGFVRWEREPLRARRGPRFEEIGAVFEALHDHADSLPEALVAGCRWLETESRREDGEPDRPGSDGA